MSQFRFNYIFHVTVKLGIKELLNKEQTEFKELFTDYQPFYTVNLLLNKEHWQSRKCQNLALVKTRLWKLAKKRTLEIFWTKLGFYTKKRAHKIRVPHFWNQTYDWLQKTCHFFLIHTFLGDPVPNLELIDTLYGTYSTNSERLAIRKIWF